MSIRWLTGDCRETLRTLAPGSVQSAVTSPPYYGLRDYGLPPLVWGGIEHEHEWLATARYFNNKRGAAHDTEGAVLWAAEDKRLGAWQYQDCPCGAWLGSLGLEPTPELYVQHLVEVFREVRRVLRDDGCMFVNLGDSYAGSGKGPSNSVQSEASQIGPSAVKKRNPAQFANGQAPTAWIPVGAGYKPKDLMMMPARVAMALQADGWYLRSQIPWVKRNCLSGGARVYVRCQKGDMPMTVKELARLSPSTVQLWNGEQWTRLMNVWRVEPETDTLELQLRSGETIGCTPEHRWPTLRGLLTAADLRVGDVIQTTQLPGPQEPHAPAGLEDDLTGWFVGLYIAEGYRDKHGVIKIASHTKEIERQTKLEELARAYDGTCWTRHNGGRSMTINLSGPVLNGILDAYVWGEGAASKHLTNRAWQRSDDFLHAVLMGYLSGDGHWDALNRRWRLGFCENDRWAQDLRILCGRLGIGLRLHRARHQLNGRILPGWRGQIRLEREHKSVGSQFILADDAEVVRIGFSRGGSFWDIEVADDPHTFALASGVLTHNSMPESVIDRPATAVEYVYLLSKQSRYFWDADAVRMESAPSAIARSGLTRTIAAKDGLRKNGTLDGHTRAEEGLAVGQYGAGRNRRNSDWFFESWQGLMLDEQDEPIALVVNPMPYKNAHFATFGTRLVEPMVKASTSERGQCPECAAPWMRTVEHGNSEHHCRPGCGHLNRDFRDGWNNGQYGGFTNTARVGGWRPSCAHTELRPVPQTILDPFAGAGTTLLVADRLGRDAIGCELNSNYGDMGIERLRNDAPMFVEFEDA